MTRLPSFTYHPLPGELSDQLGVEFDGWSGDQPAVEPATEETTQDASPFRAPAIESDEHLVHVGADRFCRQLEPFGWDSGLVEKNRRLLSVVFVADRGRDLLEDQRADQAAVVLGRIGKRLRDSLPARAILAVRRERKSVR